MPKRSQTRKNIDEKKKISLDDPPFVSKWSHGWVPFPYHGVYLGETQILTYIQNNIHHFENHTRFQVFEWSCELLQDDKNWVVKSNGKIVLRRCILSSHKCKECSKVFFLPWPFKDWLDPEQANYCYSCRKNSFQEESLKFQNSNSGAEVKNNSGPNEAIAFNSISVEK